MNNPTVQRSVLNDKRGSAADDPFARDAEIVKEREAIDRHSLEMQRLRAETFFDTRKQLQIASLYAEHKRQKEEAEARLEARRVELQKQSSLEANTRGGEETRRERTTALLAEKGKTGRQWARDAGVDQGTVQQFMSGKTKKLSSPARKRLADALGITVGEMIALEEMPK